MDADSKLRDARRSVALLCSAFLECGMKMAKASKEDIQRCVKMFHLIEEFMEYGTHTPQNDEYRGIDRTERRRFRGSVAGDVGRAVQASGR